MKLEYTGKGGYCFETENMAGIIEFCPVTSTHTLQANTVNGFIQRTFETFGDVKRYLIALAEMTSA